MLKDFNLLEIFWGYDIIVTLDMPSLGYYAALGLYSAGKGTNKTPVISTVNDVYSGKNGQAPEVRYIGRFR